MDRVFKRPKCNYTVNSDGTITTDGSFKGKITGTQMGALMGCSPWSTPFQVACAILGLTTEDISNKPAVKAGVALESRIIDYVGANHSDIGLFIPAEDIFEAREGDHDDWASDFDDPIFGGHVDGMVMTESGDNYILEVKTSMNMDSWVDGVPEYYYWQVALYNHFLVLQDKAYVALGIVTEQDRRDPLGWKPGEDTVGLFEMDIDQEQVDKGIDLARKWYERYISKNTTPPYDPTNPKDVAMFEYLSTLTVAELDMADLVDELADVDAELAARERGLEGLKAKREELRNQIKSYMDARDMKSLESTSGAFVAKMSTQTRSKIDPVKLAEDGLDPEKYTEKTVSKTFSVKVNKEAK